MSRSLLERTAALPSSAYYLNEESQAAVKAEAKRLKDRLAAKRAKTAIEQAGGERRNGDRRAGEFDRRANPRREEDRTGERRRFATMDDKLAAQADKHRDRRFDEDARPSAFLDSIGGDKP